MPDKKDKTLNRLFEECLRQLCPELTEIRLIKTRVFTKSRHWEIILGSDKYITHENIKALEEKLNSKFTEIPTIKFRFIYSIDPESLVHGFDHIWNDLIEDIKAEMPAVSTILNLCRYSWDKNELIITTERASDQEILYGRSVHKHIEKWISNTFNLSARVRFQGDNSDSTGNGDEYLVKKQKEDLELARQVVYSTQQANGKEEKTGRNSAGSSGIIYGKSIKDKPESIGSLTVESGKVTIEGKLFGLEFRDLKKNGKKLGLLDITDYTGSITAKLFLESGKTESIKERLTLDRWYKIRGKSQYDPYQREIVLSIDDINSAPDRLRLDNAPEKRVELHLHTQMSAMDGVSSAKQLIDRAAMWGHEAIAITDHGVVQAYPEAYAEGKKKGIKIILGVEAYLINDYVPIVQNSRDIDFNQTYVAFDIETTGLSPKKNEIIEIGAVKIRNRSIVATFSSFIKPEKPIPQNITKLTGISNDMVLDAPKVDTILPDFLDFCGDAVLVAHNASFDLGFIKEYAQRQGITIDNPVLDTLSLSRELLKELKKHKLDIVADHLKIKLENHHRALDDAATAGEILLKLMDKLEKMGITSLNEINDALSRRTNLNGLTSYHAVILVRNEQGLKNLYKLVSKSHLEYYYRKPRIPKSLLASHREGLIIGSACEAGELYRAVLDGLPDEDLSEIVNFYDYLEIQPLCNNEHLVRSGQVAGMGALKDINRKILELGESHGKRVVATGDVHFLDPEDEYFRRILMSGQNYDDADTQAPLYFKTTEEMLEEFSYLGESVAYEVVVKAPRSIAADIQEIKPVPDKLYPPEIPGAEEEIRSMAITTAKEIYGDPLPEIVEKRLNKELDSIIGNGYAVLYLIAHKLVKKSLNDGYLVGSRGSVGSSFVATMTGITEVNPLPPHYICPKCKHSDFDIDTGMYACGADLPDKSCPKCGEAYNKAGYDIPFEVFLGFKGDKVPDIDLNFSGEYQPTAHKYTEELFGEGHVFRAGTIGTIAEKTAYGFVKKYLEDKQLVVTNAEIKRLVAGCTGVKRTTGQHPGGILVVPKSMEIYDFTPIQYPADDKESGTITSHFDFHSIHDTLVKLDILGHDDPTVIRMLEDLTGIDARSIPIGEKTTMKLFSSTDPLDVSPEEIGSVVGTFGIPEFGTKFVRQMLEDTRPTTFAELIRISGLSHGTDVWLNNAQDLIRSNTATLVEVISTRDDIMLYLMYQGMEPTLAFKIMENVRKGKGLTPEMEEVMVSNNVPKWYIDSCKKIKYMFPKAHAVAYVIMAFRIAYFKVYYPKAFYAAYFTVRGDDFDAELILQGRDAIKEKIRYLDSRGNDLSAKEKNLLTILEVALEMYARGFNFEPIDLYRSDAVSFLVTEKGLRPPLKALQGVGENAAKSIAEARSKGEFVSIEDFRERTKVTKTVIEVMKSNNILKNIPETSQLSLF